MSGDSQSNGGWRAWAQLVRAPNLLTAPGDPLAGLSLALLGGAEGRLTDVIPCAITSLCLYAAGMISNDYFDFRADLVERPGRPLPSGLIKRGAALGVAVLMAVIGIVVAWRVGYWALGIACVLTAAIVSYNAGLKKVPGVGCINMGACRGLSLLLGASVAGRPGLTSYTALSAACGLTLYVAAVTAIAATETESVRIGGKRWVPAGVLIACFVLLTIARPPGTPLSVAGAALAALSIAWAWRCGAVLAGVPAPAKVSATIGRFLQGLLLVQAAFCAQLLWSGVIAGLVLVAGWPILTTLAKRFYQS